VTYRTPYERRATWLRLYRAALALLVVFVVSSLLDTFLLSWVTTLEPGTRIIDRTVASDDWYMGLRVVGSLWAWLVVAIVMWRLAHARSGLAVLCGAGLAGIISELVKMIIARERPVDGAILRETGYAFRAPFTGFADATNLGFPSSHTAVAFGGIVTLALLVPRLWIVLIPLAAGSAMTRMLVAAHYPSDVAIGAVIGIGAGWWVASIQPRPDRKFTL